jgi:integrase
LNRWDPGLAQLPGSSLAGRCPDDYCRPSAALATIQPVFTDAERIALAGSCKYAVEEELLGTSPAVTPRTLGHAFITAALDAGVPLRDVQEAASHAGPRTTMRYDRARGSLDRHATYIVAAYLAGAAR